jgi:hypothetical protein
MLLPILLPVHIDNVVCRHNPIFLVQQVNIHLFDYFVFSRLLWCWVRMLWDHSSIIYHQVKAIFTMLQNIWWLPTLFYFIQAIITYRVMTIQCYNYIILPNVLFQPLFYTIVFIYAQCFGWKWRSRSCSCSCKAASWKVWILIYNSIFAISLTPIS